MKVDLLIIATIHLLTMGGFSFDQKGFSGVDLKNNTTTSAPTVNDDSSKGYSFGSCWYNQSSGKLYILVDSSEGAANWISVNGENYKGSWDASTNTPTLADGFGISGDNYKVSVAGSQNLGSGTIVFTVGDLVIYNGTIWEKIEGGVAYVPEDVANKSTDGTMSANSATLYPSQSAVVTYASAKVADSITDGVTAVAPSQNAVFDALALKQTLASKDATGGYVGLTLFKINFKNVANTFTSFFTNSNTAARTYTFQDRDGTILDSTDLSTINTSLGTKQDANLNLTSLASLTLPANGLLYSTGANTITTSTVTAAARTVLDDADTDSMLNTLAGATSTGTGGLVRATSPTLITPALGTPSALVGTNITGTATGLSIGGNAATATTATTANTVTTNANLTGAVTSVGNAALLGSFTSAQLLAALSTKTGTGNNVFATSPTFVTPVLGTPASGDLANCSGYLADALPIGVSIQTLHTIKTDTATTTSSTYAAIAGISRAITPTDVNSKIRVTVVLQCGGVLNSRANFRLFRGATQIAFANAAAPRTQDTACFSSGGNGAMGTAVIEALDSPGVATSITYTVQWSSSDNVSAMYINRTSTDTALATFPRTISTIILSEIKG